MLLVLQALAHPSADARIVALEERLSPSGLVATDAEVHLLRAAVFEDRGEPAEALAALAAAAACGSDAVHLPRARVLLRAGDAASALAIADLVSLAEPGAGLAWLLRARARVALGDERGARADYSLATARLDEVEPDLWLERARLADRLGEADAAPALAAEAEARGQYIESIELRAFEAELGSDSAAALKRAETSEQHFYAPPWIARRADALARLGRAGEARLARSDARRQLLRRFSHEPRPAPVITLLVQLERDLEPP